MDFKEWSYGRKPAYARPVGVDEAPMSGTTMGDRPAFSDHQVGLCLVEVAAVAAMQGLCASPAAADWRAQEVARTAVNLAEALVRELRGKDVWRADE